MKKLYMLAAVSALCLASSQSFAAGYQLNEYSVTGLGRAFAGAGVVGDDFSSLAYNPAGMVLNQTSGVQSGLSVAELYARIRGTNASSTKQELAKMHYGVPLPHIYGQYKANDRLTFGLGVYTPYGLKTTYKKNSFVANDGVKSELEVVDIAPAIAYRVTDKLSFGASVIARYIHGHMTNTMAYQQPGLPVPLPAYSDFDLDGWTMAWSVGAMYEFTPDTRLGVSFKGKSMQTVKGNHEVEVDASLLGMGIMKKVAYDGKASPDLPQTLLISGFHKLNDKWGLSASARWTDWEDSFPEFTLESSLGGKTVNESWRQTWTVSFGADYYLNENWTLRFGTAYDQSPIRNKYHRTVRIPDNNRIWLSFGATYKTGNWQFDAGYTRLFMQNYGVEEPSGTKAQFESYSNIFGLQAQYKF